VTNARKRTTVEIVNETVETMDNVKIINFIVKMGGMVTIVRKMPVLIDSTVQTEGNADRESVSVILDLLVTNARSMSAMTLIVETMDNV